VERIVRIVAFGVGGAAPVQLRGELAAPPNPLGVVVFAHGSGSSRLSPRNAMVAETLRERGMATLLFDLLTDAEARDRRNVFDIPLLGDRLLRATAWVRARRDLGSLPIGCFGASTGAAAALWAAGESGEEVAAVVSRGGRPDLVAASRLADVRAPTLLIVGGWDPQVVDANREAQASLRCPNELEVVPGATHLFEERGALEAVADLAGDWFERYLGQDEEGP
jgi:putative phosphoribosyl transferase